MKHIKKSMFISTVLMVVMLIAALSTATFAWYTSNSTVTSTKTEAYAAKSTAANIGIGWSRGSTGNTIKFHALANSIYVENEQTHQYELSDIVGSMMPVVPVTYFAPKAKLTNEDPNLNNGPAALYTTGDNPEAISYYLTSTTTSGATARIVNLTTDQITNKTFVASVVNHNFAGGVYTNITASTLTDYQVVYYEDKYAYHNDNPTSEDAAAVVDGPVMVDSSLNYHAKKGDDHDEDLEATDTTYKVIAVYNVDQTGADTVAEANEANGWKIKVAAAGAVLGGGRQANEGTKVVKYRVYTVVPYTNIDPDALPAGAVGLGTNGTGAYAVQTANTLNGTDISISSMGDYGLSTAASNIKFNDAGFTYLHKIYDANTQPVTPTVTYTNGVASFTGFDFNKASVDTNGFFKEDKSNPTPGSLWTDNSNSTNNYDKYTWTNQDLVVVTGPAEGTGETRQAFYVTNNSQDTAIDNLTVTLKTDGANKDLLRVAVFRDGSYIGTLAGSNNAATYFGTVLENANSYQLPTYSANNKLNLGKLSPTPASAAQITLVAWFDGQSLNADTAGAACTFELVFEQGASLN